MKNKDNIFPKITKNIEYLIEDQEGNIPGNKLLMLGAMVIVLGNMFAAEAFAGHHTSHSSHSSHSSHGSGSHGSHGNHSSHVSHHSHASHSNVSSHHSHASHSNVSSHSSSGHSSGGGVGGTIHSWSDESRVPEINDFSANVAGNKFNLPEVNQNIEIPNNTPNSTFIPSVGVPATTSDVKIDAGDMYCPSDTEKIR